MLKFCEAENYNTKTQHCLPWMAIQEAANPKAASEASSWGLNVMGY